MSRSVLFLVLAIALCASLVSGQTGCTGAGYDVSALAGTTYQYVVSGGWGVSNYTYYLAPCGTVSAPPPVNCTGASFCQFESDFNGSYPLQYFNSTVAVQWLAVPGGVQQIVQDGAFCGAINAYRETTIFFQCNSSATTPYFSGVQEFETCHYQATLQTAAACTSTGTTGPNGVGSSWISPVCGGGVYGGLSALSSQTIWYDTNSSSSTDGYIFYVSPCGVMTNTTGCPNQPNAMVCQADKYGDTYTIAAQNASVPTIWTLYSNGISMSIQDGTLCGSDGDREVLIYFVCDSTASTPVIVSFGEGETCHYTGYIRTAAVCSSATSGGSSSSTGVAVVGSSSSTASSPSPSPSSSSAAPSPSPSSSGAANPSSGTVIVVPSSSAGVPVYISSSSSGGGPSASGAVSTSSLSAAALILCAAALFASLAL